MVKNIYKNCPACGSELGKLYNRRNGIEKELKLVETGRNLSYEKKRLGERKGGGEGGGNHQYDCK